MIEDARANVTIPAKGWLQTNTPTNTASDTAIRKCLYERSQIRNNASSARKYKFSRHNRTLPSANPTVFQQCFYKKEKYLGQ